MKRLLLFIVAIFIVVVSPAQAVTNNESVMLQHGKIYVVMAVAVTILIGLFLYVWSVDRKIKKLED